MHVLCLSRQHRVFGPTAVNLKGALHVPTDASCCGPPQDQDRQLCTAIKRREPAEGWSYVWLPAASSEVTASLDFLLLCAGAWLAQACKCTLSLLPCGLVKYPGSWCFHRNIAVAVMPAKEGARATGSPLKAQAVSLRPEKGGETLVCHPVAAIQDTEPGKVQVLPRRRALIARRLHRNECL